MHYVLVVSLAYHERLFVIKSCNFHWLLACVRSESDENRAGII